jgi:hypothetical protein
MTQDNNQIEPIAQSLQMAVSVSAFLTGKAKQDFIEYYCKYYIAKTRFLNKKSETEEFFESLYPTFKKALIIEWFDSIGFHIGRDMVENYWLENSTFFEGLEINGYDYIAILKSDSEAIEKANELYNAHFLADTQAEH